MLDKAAVSTRNQCWLSGHLSPCLWGEDMKGNRLVSLPPKNINKQQHALNRTWHTVNTGQGCWGVRMGRNGLRCKRPTPLHMSLPEKIAIFLETSEDDGRFWRRWRWRQIRYAPPFPPSPRSALQPMCVFRGRFCEKLSCHVRGAFRKPTWEDLNAPSPTPHTWRNGAVACFVILSLHPTPGLKNRKLTLCLTQVLPSLSCTKILSNTPRKNTRSKSSSTRSTVG